MHTQHWAISADTSHNCLQVSQDSFQHISFSAWVPWWGTTDAEMKVPSAENPKLSQVLSLKTWSWSECSFVCLADCQGYIYVFCLLSQFVPPPLPNSLKLKRGVGQNVALYALLTARDPFLSALCCQARDVMNSDIGFVIGWLEWFVPIAAFVVDRVLTTR